MKIPLSWLREYVLSDVTPVDLAHRLTMAGLETTYDEGISGDWEGVFIGNVIEVIPHPNADRLRLATVDLQGELLTVVCGAPNLLEGQKVALATVGAKLIDATNGQRSILSEVTIRGIKSQGMICSKRELGLGDDHTGILTLSQDAPIGQALSSYLKSGAFFELEVTANRGDWLSVLGVAREVAAVTGTHVTEPSLGYAAKGPATADLVSISVAAPDLCSRYTAIVVQGVQVGPSPQWMQDRLISIGLRPINNIVDVTNYVMMEYGQPLHAFDLAKLKQATLIVREAEEGEKLETLDGEQYELKPSMLLIADAEKAIGIAGIMGGANTAVADDTKDVLLEAATFSAVNTRLTAGILKMRTEASNRFEKGLNPELAIRAVQRATSLILEVAGGSATKDVIDIFPGNVAPQPILFTQQRLIQVLGESFTTMKVVEVLKGLGFRCDVKSKTGESIMVIPPYWRTDVSIEDDLIEEVARIIGYDAIPALPLRGPVPDHMFQPVRGLRESIKDLLVAIGFQETISYSLVSWDDLKRVSMVGNGMPEPLKLTNPMSREHEYLRTTLRCSVLRTISEALKRTSSNLRMFELGRVYLRRSGDLPEEREMLVGVMAGGAAENLWDQTDNNLDYYDAKGAVESMLANLGITPKFAVANDSLLCPGRIANVMINGSTVGVVGELHPDIRNSFDIDRSTAAFFELDLLLVLEQLPTERHLYRGFSRFPSADRDLAVVVNDTVPADRLREILEDHPMVLQATLFDLFTGVPLPPGKKSLAYRLELQSSDATLNTEQVNQVVASQMERLTVEVGATLRAQERDQ